MIQEKSGTKIVS